MRLRGCLSVRTRLFTSPCHFVSSASQLSAREAEPVLTKPREEKLPSLSAVSLARSRYRFEPVAEKQSIFSGAAVVFFCPVRGRGKPSGYGTEGFLRFEGRSAHEVGLGEKGTLGKIKSLVESE